MSLTEAIEKYRKMDARERDAIVAEKVMRWLNEDDYRDRPIPRGEITTFANEVQRVLRGVPYQMHNGDWSRHYENWRPSTAPADDYSVLQHVRETWDLCRESLFSSALTALWSGRNGLLPTFIMAYAPGDYSLAAIVAHSLSEQPSNA